MTRAEQPPRHAEPPRDEKDQARHAEPPRRTERDEEDQARYAEPPPADTIEKPIAAANHRLQKKLFNYFRSI
jgi:hypothetical protein